MGAHLREEVNTLEAWRHAGTLVDAYSPGEPGAVLFLELPDLQHAETLLATLPMCEAGLIETEIIGLHRLLY
jgi:hypothetical protein